MFMMQNFITGLKANDQLVAYATRFSAVRLKQPCLVAPPRLKSQSTVRFHFSSAYSPECLLTPIDNINKLININVNKGITQRDTN